MPLPRQGCSPLIPEKKKIPNGNCNRLEQEQPTHATPFGLRLGILHSPKQRRLRQEKACDDVPRFFSAMVALKHHQLDRFVSIALRQRFYCLWGETVLKRFFGHHKKGVYQKRPAHVFLISMAHFGQVEPPTTCGLRRAGGVEPRKRGRPSGPHRHYRGIAKHRLP